MDTGMAMDTAMDTVMDIMMMIKVNRGIRYSQKLKICLAKVKVERLKYKVSIPPIIYYLLKNLSVFLCFFITSAPL
jgi:hypothetical protein